MVSKISSVILVGISILGLACSTTKDFEKQNETPRFSEQIHVHQTNGLDILTELDRDHWLQTRKTTDNDQLKLYSSLGAREWSVAISDARAYLESHPGDFAALTVLSSALAMEQNFSLANYYSRLLDKLYPGQAETQNIMGLAILNRPGATFQDYQKAAKFFERAFESDEKQIASGLNLGHLHLESGNSQAAKEVFTLVKQRCGNCSAALYGLGIAASRLKDFALAKSTFEDILSEDSGNIQAKYYLALVENYGFNKQKEAARILGEVLESKETEDLEVMRQANFLKRRIEAQIYAQKIRETPKFDNDPNKEAIAEKDESPEKTQETEETNDPEQVAQTPEERADDPEKETDDEKMTDKQSPTHKLSPVEEQNSEIVPVSDEDDDSDFDATLE